MQVELPLGMVHPKIISEFSDSWRLLKVSSRQAPHPRVIQQFCPQKVRFEAVLAAKGFSLQLDHQIRFGKRKPSKAQQTNTHQTKNKKHKTKQTKNQNPNPPIHPSLKHHRVTALTYRCSLSACCSWAGHYKITRKARNNMEKQNILHKTSQHSPKVGAQQ